MDGCPVAHGATSPRREVTHRDRKSAEPDVEEEEQQEASSQEPTRTMYVPGIIFYDTKQLDPKLVWFWMIVVAAIANGWQSYINSRTITTEQAVLSQTLVGTFVGFGLQTVFRSLNLPPLPSGRQASTVARILPAALAAMSAIVFGELLLLSLPFTRFTVFLLVSVNTIFSSFLFHLRLLYLKEALAAAVVSLLAWLYTAHGVVPFMTIIYAVVWAASVSFLCHSIPRGSSPLGLAHVERIFAASLTAVAGVACLYTHFTALDGEGPFGVVYNIMSGAVPPPLTELNADGTDAAPVSADGSEWFGPSVFFLFGSLARSNLWHSTVVMSSQSTGYSGANSFGVGVIIASFVVGWLGLSGSVQTSVLGEAALAAPVSYTLPYWPYYAAFGATYAVACFVYCSVAKGFGPFIPRSFPWYLMCYVSMIDFFRCLIGELMFMVVKLLVGIANRVLPRSAKFYISPIRLPSIPGLKTGTCHMVSPSGSAKPEVLQMNVGHMNTTRDWTDTLRAAFNMTLEFVEDPKVGGPGSGFAGSLQCDFAEYKNEGLRSITPSNYISFNLSAWESQEASAKWYMNNSTHKQIVKAYHTQGLDSFSALLSSWRPAAPVRYQLRCRNCRAMVPDDSPTQSSRKCAECGSDVPPIPMF